MIVFQNGNTPLMVAAWKGRQDIVAFLCARGADVHARNNVNATPKDRTFNVHDIISPYVMVSNVQDGYAAIHWRVSRRKAESIVPETTAILLNYGADLYAATNVIHVSTACQTSRELITKSQSGETALHMLATRFTRDEIEFIGRVQQTCLLVAVKAGDLRRLRKLIEDERIDVDHVLCTVSDFFSHNLH